MVLFGIIDMIPMDEIFYVLLPIMFIAGLISIAWNIDRYSKTSHAINRTTEQDDEIAELRADIQSLRKELKEGKKDK